MNFVLQFFAACHSIVAPLIEVRILTEARLNTALSLVMCIDVVVVGLIIIFGAGEFLWGGSRMKIVNCVRCTLIHEVDVRVFVIPIVDADGTVWDRYALCPTNGDPILIRTTVIKEGAKDVEHTNGFG